MRLSADIRGALNVIAGSFRDVTLTEYAYNAAALMKPRNLTRRKFLETGAVLLRVFRYCHSQSLNRGGTGHPNHRRRASTHSRNGTHGVVECAAAHQS
jgi:hypothetical protein